MDKIHVVLDIETDGLIDEVSLIHCLCFYIIETGVRGTITDYEEMRKFLLQENLVIIGHNIIRYDIPVTNKILGIKITAKLIDTLGLSWYLYPTEVNTKGELKVRKKHGLEVWGEYFGIEKPKIEDWTNQSIGDYIHRCQRDVEINLKLWFKQIDYLQRIYEGMSVDRIIGYLSFKLDCAREQEEVKWKLNVKLCEETLEKLETDRSVRFEKLANAMPKVINYKTVSRPKELYKKDGTLSVKGKAWMDLLEESMLDPNWTDDIQVYLGEERGNPNSPAQMKDWLFSLGWKPITFDYKKNKTTGTTRAIPQINNDDGVCPSVQLLYEQEPVLEELDTLTVITHRVGILKGFLANRDKNDFVKAEVSGFTNTLRFQHTTIVNLPTIHKPYGKEIRGSLIIPDSEHVLCGSDMSSLEDNTKRHYMWKHDPEYVKEQMFEGFDSHLDIGVTSGMITKEDSDFYKEFNRIKDADKYHKFTEEEEKRYKSINKVRKDAKQVNFSAVYGVGPPKLSLTTGWEIQKATTMLEVYWKRNWSVKVIAKETYHKVVDGQMWLWNPVSEFWYSLRYEKDKFSTLNQGTGVYCFDSWVRKVRAKGIKICGQFHDEIIALVKLVDKDVTAIKLKEAIQETNDELKLNIQLGISIDFGETYAQIH